MTADFSPSPRTARSGAVSHPAGAGTVASGDCPNVLARNTVFSGTIEVTDSIRLEGKFKGEIWTQGTLHVVPEAVVQGKFQATNVVIGGKFEGDVHCERRVDLLAKCKATGTLVTDALTVEEGALFDGKVVMTKRPAAPSRDTSGDVAPA